MGGIWSNVQLSFGLAVRAGFPPRVRFFMPVRAQTPRLAAGHRHFRHHADDRHHHGFRSRASDRWRPGWARRASRRDQPPVAVAAALAADAPPRANPARDAAQDLAAFFHNSTCGSSKPNSKHGARIANRVATVKIGRADALPAPTAETPAPVAAVEASQAGSGNAEKPASAASERMVAPKETDRQGVRFDGARREPTGGRCRRECLCLCAATPAPILPGPILSPLCRSLWLHRAATWLRGCARAVLATMAVTGWPGRRHRAFSATNRNS